jgi:hypothetical protein
VSSAVLDTRGGVGGPPPDNYKGVPHKCPGCNAGGDGGKGLIFLMDEDGLIGGLVPGYPGVYDDEMGVVTISDFKGDRFEQSVAITELFNVGASDPTYSQMSDSDILVNLTTDQGIRIFASSSKGDLDEPLEANPTTEMGAIEIAEAIHSGGSVIVTITGDMRLLNPTGAPNRDAFTRIETHFEYKDMADSALGPFASIDQVDISFTFNG